jgi:hypothetical protein
MLLRLTKLERKILLVIALTVVLGLAGLALL